ncbi:MAG: hypothetical protein R3277_01920 [Brumimicrobium sp.]|nr:hypothetical protein [Brumimicrobium sp.]
MLQNILRIAVPFLLPFLLGGCFEFIEDTSLNADGSGTYKIVLNMSASQTRLNSVMALDSLNGKKVPSEAELKKEVQDFVSDLNKLEGISGATATFSTDDWILKFSCDFKSLDLLQNAITAMLKKEGNKNSLQTFLRVSYESGIYSREIKEQIPDEWREKAVKDEDYNKLNSGKCVFIQRFEHPIKKTSKESVRIAKNQKACMLILTPDQILRDPSILNYSVIIAD